MSHYRAEVIIASSEDCLSTDEPYIAMHVLYSQFNNRANGSKLASDICIVLVEILVLKYAI